MSARLDPSGVVWLRWAWGLEITGELAREAMRLVDELNDGRQRPLLVDMTGTAVLTRAARLQFGQPCSVSRLALVGRSAVDRVIANFAVGVSKHPMPMRFFTTESGALTWLHRHRAADERPRDALPGDPQPGGAQPGGARPDDALLTDGRPEG